MRTGAEFRELMLQVVRTRMAFRRAMQRTLKKNNAGITFEMLQVLHVLQIGAVTKQQKGEELADIEGMIQAGIPAISEDGKSVMNVKLYKEAMEIAAKHNIPVFAHCEDQNMVSGG